MITDQVILFIQMAAIVSFVIAVFIIYRLLVKQKEATIRLQEEQISFLKVRLANAESDAPDDLALALANHVKMYEEELQRIIADKFATEDEVNEKEEKLRQARSEAEELTKRIAHATELLRDYLSPVARREYQNESMEYVGREIDIEHEYKLFECGLEVLDGTQSGKCGSAE